MKSFTLERIGPKTVLGLALIALSFVIYLIFESTNTYHTNTEYFIPMGVASFGIGFHLALSKIKALQSIKKVLTFIVIGILAFGIFTWMGWEKYILDSSYAMTLAELTTNFAVSILNWSGIHATQSGHTIIFPPESKISQVDVLPACAGLHESAIFLAAFGLMIIDLSRKAPKKKLAIIFVLGSISVFFANMARIMFLIYVGYAFGYDALETDHLYAGTIMFLSLIGLLWWLSLRWILKKPQTQINHQDLV
ncbi:MAG TPA: exosortase/archaeosortase family protein [Nitrosopumilaceae archaeon]|nr:exosortase/archaeosortase family protein [Nitrosopumilaceae archaeon]